MGTETMEISYTIYKANKEIRCHAFACGGLDVVKSGSRCQWLLLLHCTALARASDLALFTVPAIITLSSTTMDIIRQRQLEIVTDARSHSYSQLRGLNVATPKEVQRMNKTLDVG